MARNKFILLEKLLVAKSVVRRLDSLQRWPIKSISQINLLTTIKLLNDRSDINCTFTGIMLFLRANNRSSRKSKVEEELVQFANDGLIFRKGTRVIISQYGLNTLSEIEEILKKAHFKYRRSDSGTLPTKNVKKRIIKIKSSIAKLLQFISYFLYVVSFIVSVIKNIKA